MGESDGGVLLDVKLDPGDAAKEFDRLTRKAQGLEEKLARESAELGKAKEKAVALKEQLGAAQEKQKALTDESRATTEELKKQAALIEAKRKELTGADSTVAFLRESSSFDDPQLNAYVERSARIGEELEAAITKQKDLESHSNSIAEQLKGQDKLVNRIQKDYDAAGRNVERLAQSVENTNTTLTATQEKAARVAQEMGKGHPALDKMGESAQKLENRLKKLASRVLIFSVFTAGLRSLRSWFADVIKTDEEAVTAVGQLKGALLTLVQPLVSVVIPAFTGFVQVLTQVVGAIASVVSSLMGSTVEESAKAAEALDKEKKALNGVGSAAKKASKPLAGFDEINKLSWNEGASGGGGGAGGKGTEIAPDFSFLDNASEKLKEIADLVLLVGGGFALWKLGSFLGGLAEAYPALTGLLGPLGKVLQIAGGAAAAIAGIVLAIDGITDAWENGVDWGNAAKMIGGVALAAGGLYLALAPIAPALAPVVAGIALVAGGLAMLITGFHDAAENGWNLQNTLLSVAGLFATGLGIALITHGFIPALIGAVAGLLLAITVATGHGEELLEGVKMVLQGFKDFFIGIFTGDIERAVGGINNIFAGMEMAIGAVLDGIRDGLLAFLDWIDEKTHGKLHGLIEGTKQLIMDTFDSIKAGAGLFLDSLKEIFLGLIEFISGIFALDFDKAWQGIVKILDGICGLMVAPFITAVNLIIDGLNALIRGMNKISFKAPDWVPGIGGKNFGINIPAIPKIEVPRLAQGAVIPPNREFAAVLGDQTHGNNLEGPEELFRRIVREESGAGGDSAGVVALLRQILAAIQEGKVMVVDKTVFAQLVSASSDSERFRRGEPMVTVH